MNANTLLVELGYTTSPLGITTFQRDYNRFATRTLLVTGELDADTKKALEFAYQSRVVFLEIRGADNRGGRRA
jgi:hypothetical protein